MRPMCDILAIVLCGFAFYIIFFISIGRVVLPRVERDVPVEEYLIETAEIEQSGEELEVSDLIDEVLLEETKKENTTDHDGSGWILTASLEQEGKEEETKFPLLDETAEVLESSGTLMDDN